jgi:hypothetical protein
MIKNHAEFKRLLKTPGVQLETLSLAKFVKAGRISVGQIRKINKADTTGVYLAMPGDTGRGSFLGYDKASDWEFSGDVATNTVVGYSYRVIMPMESVA